MKDIINILKQLITLESNRFENFPGYLPTLVWNPIVPCQKCKVSMQFLKTIIGLRVFQDISWSRNTNMLEWFHAISIILLVSEGSFREKTNRSKEFRDIWLCLEFKYFEIQLFDVTDIVLLFPEMYCCKVLLTKIIELWVSRILTEEEIQNCWNSCFVLLLYSFGCYVFFEK